MSNTSITEKSDVGDEPERQTLPTNVKPIHYDLTLDPNLNTFKFDGFVTIDLKVQENSDFITLHTLALELIEVKLFPSSKSSVSDAANSDSDGSIKPVSTEYTKEDQTTTFHFEKDTLIKDETVKLYVKFIGELNNKLAGFYRSSYEVDGEKKYLATTQMEPADCRRVFPCFDEPKLKATFDISLIIDSNLTGVSNMDVKDEVSMKSNRKKISFNTTPLMSTYLVAFVVGDLEYIESDSKFRDIPIRVYTTPGLVETGRHSVELCAKYLQYFEDLFGLPYPLPKFDIVSVPDMYGAMENWGLLIGSNQYILYDPATSTLAKKLRITETVAHEVAHQWFGNLVTMENWDSLWLNEAFATFMASEAVDHFEPGWLTWESFVGDTLQSALKDDAFRSSHPIEVPILKDNQVYEVFDNIAYKKGSSVLRMLYNWIGKDAFIGGVSKYLKANVYGSTNSEDLWSALSEVSGEDIEAIMGVWTKKVGYPVVSVKEIDDKLEFEQHRFLITGDLKPADDETIYPIFLGLKTDSGLDSSAVFDKRTLELKFPDGNVKDGFFKVNSDSTGVYRVAYSDERWKKLGSPSAQSKLSVRDRVGLVADAGALSVTGHTKTTNFLSLATGWKQENSYFVLNEIINALNDLKTAYLFDSDTFKNALNTFVLDIVSEKLHALGWSFTEASESEESIQDQKLKSLLFTTAANSGDKQVLQEVKKLFDSLAAGDSTSIHPNLRATVFNETARTGDEADYETLLKISTDSSSSATDKAASLRALGRFKQPELINRSLSLVLSGEVKPTDLFKLTNGLITHANGIEALYSWLKLNWDAIVELMPSGWSMLGTLVKISVSAFTSLEKYDDVVSFFKDKDTVKLGVEKELKQGLESIKGTASWIERDRDDVVEWLKYHGYLK
ncbi:unnamed protein product [Ambrosiozyma monospora]|uniref:Aminopeptidase n=1 Tax=Ambrosiozyma monospora TaxID=43982 RepID=A0A9W6YUX1_AMBMO|nr:unnamed protein product [Ambrosiozyma monospora]